MRFLVCLKQVPDSTTRVKVAPDGRSIVTDGLTWSISPYDEYAIELALEHKDTAADTVVSVISVGGPRTKDALRQALAMGCDDATLVTGDGADALGPLGIARALASAVEDLRPDLVLCGKQASDDDQGFVGQALAEALGWPHVSQITKLVAAPRGMEIFKEVEGGHEVWAASAGAVLTVQKSEKEPRYPSLPGIMKAKKKEIPERPVAGVADPVTVEIVKLEPPPPRGGGRVFKDGDTQAHAVELAKLLRDEAKVL
ncbi:MAG TPA: electron transfer flavoprotein subunit beta/FixA family protein [Candidatus Limnocylindria bacterium]|nr:electron transfer flavoprotein subunit beta/FixA family protein [Candidatus Limnocylindria bacterium]